MSKIIYVLEDEKEIRTTISEYLKMLGHEVHAFSEPLYCPIYHVNKCTCKNEKLCTDIIITDINMPRISGLEFLEKIKENGCRAPHIAIMSATWTKKEQQEAIASGYKIFRKPFDLLELKKWIDNCKFTTIVKKKDKDNYSSTIVLSENSNIREHPCSVEI